MLTRRVARATRVFVICFLVALINNTNATAQSVPAPWNAQDIGSPAIPGTATFDQNEFTVTAAGKDIWGQSDQFTFVYQQVTGDVDVVARVDSVTMAHSWSKSGVMIRSSLAANSAHGFALVSAGKGVAFQYRTVAGGTSSNAAGPSATAPRWVRLVRVGTTLTAYTSADGTTWAVIGSSTIALGSVAYVGLATTSHNTAAATTAVLSQVAIVPLALPSPQKAVDIGAPAIKGSTSYRQGVYTVHAGGADIWGSSDQFHFVYQQVSGDVEVIARVNSITYADQWSKTGVMIRETLTAGSRHAYALGSAGKGYAFQRRADTGGLSDHTAGPAGTPPGWVRLVRTGSQIEAFQSSDGTTWKSMGTDAIPMADSVYVGIATTSHKTTKATDAVVDNFKVIPIGSTQNQPPIVALTAPAGGTTFTAGTNLAIGAAASDSDGTISRVDFFAGTTPIGSDTTQPYAVTWAAVPAGTYSLTAVATDNDGAKTTSATVTATATVATNQPPAVTLTAPADGATYTAPASVSLAASATDADGTIARVEFYVGTTLLATDATSPYSYSWAGVGAGTYSLTAVAYDAAGARATSVARTLTVTATTTVPSPWIAADIGAPALSGSATYNGGVFAVDVGGVDIWNTSDQFHFVYQPVAGDVEIVARVDSLTVVDPYTNAGVMIRSVLTAGSIHGYTAETGSNGVYFRQRIATGGTTTSIQGAIVTAPVWVRLVRKGTLITSYSSTDGSNWAVIGSQTLALGTTAYVGLAVSSHNATTRTSARFSNVRVTQPTQSPTVSITSPTTGALYTAPATVVITASASDPEGRMAAVELYAGATLVLRDTTAPYGASWAVSTPGTYALTAVAYDADGGRTTSSAVNVTVQGPNQPPTVTLTAPANGATFTAPATIALAATASDPENALARVEFYSGTTRLATDTTAPYSFSWLSVAAGTYTVRAIAYDTAGSSASSVANTITVSTVTTTPPTGVVFQASADHATLVTRYDLRIFASGADPLTATPIATSDLGKPTPDANGDITVDRATFFSNLTVGGYVAAVTAIGSGGSSTSTGVSFTR